MQMEDFEAKLIGLCADDFGMSAAIDRGILRLAEAGRISAVSCMTGGAAWPTDAPALQAWHGKISIGLHLTLTELRPLGRMPGLAPAGTLPNLGPLMQRALLRQLDAAEIRAEAERQCSAFTAAMGFAPDHVDGHQHCHGFPVIRESVLELARHYGCTVRLSTSTLRPKLARPGKALAINLLSAGFGQRLRQRAIPHNPQFFGLHGFDPADDLDGRYAAWCEAAMPGCLINCHPGDGMTAGDTLGDWRQHEHDFLIGPAFAAVLSRQNCRIGNRESRFVP